MSYRYIIWDWNGTLLNDAFLCRNVMNAILRQRGLRPMSPTRYQRIFDFPVSRYYQQLGFDFSKESFEQLGTEFIAAYEKRKSGLRLQPGARHLLHRLHLAGVKQAVLSAYQHDTLVTMLEQRGLADYFDWIVGADDHYAHGKAAQGAKLIERIKPPRGATVLVGDTIHDYEVARSIGVDCLLITAGHQSADRLNACGCPVVGSLAEAESRILEE